MIHLLDISKSYRTQMGVRNVIHPTTMSIPTDRQVAVLGENGAGKTTFLRIVAGVEQPDTGTVITDARVSWPLGFSGGLHSQLTGRQNVYLVARILGAAPREIFAFVSDFAEIGDYIDVAVRYYSSGMRARLAFGLSLAIDFDCYLIDESTSVGDKWFHEKCKAAFDARRGRSGLLFVSHSADTVREYCDLGIVIKNGRLVPFDRLDDAEEFYNRG